MQNTTRAPKSVVKTYTHLQAFQNSVVLHDMDLNGALDTFRVLEAQRIRLRLDWESERVGKTSSLGIPLRVLLRSDAHRTKQSDSTALQDLRIHEFTDQSSTAGTRIAYREADEANCCAGLGCDPLITRKEPRARVYQCACGWSWVRPGYAK